MDRLAGSVTPGAIIIAVMLFSEQGQDARYLESGINSKASTPICSLGLETLVDFLGIGDFL